MVEMVKSSGALRRHLRCRQRLLSWAVCLISEGVLWKTPRVERRQTFSVYHTLCGTDLGTSLRVTDSSSEKRLALLPSLQARRSERRTMFLPPKWTLLSAERLRCVIHSAIHRHDASCEKGRRGARGKGPSQLEGGISYPLPCFTPPHIPTTSSADPTQLLRRLLPRTILAARVFSVCSMMRQLFHWSNSIFGARDSMLQLSAKPYSDSRSSRISSLTSIRIRTALACQ
ncbi:hypothetical protein BDP55DRAFT_154325 [Colletotrichum godetiae]|uniref:Uncharacterized protein n=1 Tax=Colletotrichum godetiae TaxID=1209918 RepID=A0AAJ0AN18_9PEZI|nr:uncharacterized protein BDP55DRAFT_154325 [Colletotrichum godetiae]KAK1675433.1 hypothetical protein BDP55DRAFT_154325 [Colletotrichum godetiae]